MVWQTIVFLNWCIEGVQLEICIVAAGLWAYSPRHAWAKEAWAMA
jgi:hypothetical protein